MKHAWLVALAIVGCKGDKSVHSDDNVKPAKPAITEPPPPVVADAPPPPQQPAVAQDPIEAWAAVVSEATVDKAKLAGLYAAKPHHEDADETQRDGLDAIAAWAASPHGTIEPQIVLRDKKHGAALVLANGHYGIAAFSFDADAKITNEYICIDPASKHAAATALPAKIAVKIDDTKDPGDFAYKFEEAWDTGDAKALEAKLADDVVIYDSSVPGDIKGKAAAMDYAKQRWQVTPKRTSVYKPLWAAGDYIVDVIGWSSEKLKTNLIDCQLLEVKDGKVKSYWVVRDTAAVAKLTAK